MAVGLPIESFLKSLPDSKATRLTQLIGPVESSLNFASLIESRRESSADTRILWLGSVTKRWPLPDLSPNSSTRGMKFTIYQLKLLPPESSVVKTFPLSMCFQLCSKKKWISSEKITTESSSFYFSDQTPNCFKQGVVGFSELSLHLFLHPTSSSLNLFRF